MEIETPGFEPVGLGHTIFKDRYARSPEETWQEACRRVAGHVAQAEDNGKIGQYSERFYQQLVTNRLNPGGRIWYGAGRPKAQLLNCFIVPTGDSREAWGRTASDVIIISGLMGGVGINLSPIRGRGTLIKGTGGHATGAVSYAQLIDGVGDVIVGGGGRRMALMLALALNHPDVEEFLEVKLDKNELNNANISLIIPDDLPTERFQEMVRNSEDIELEFNGMPTGRKINAKWLWDKLVENAWKSGEPGILNGFLANKMNNLHYYRPLICTNPCFPAGELLLTKSGYVSFEELYKSGQHNFVLADNRIRYEDDGQPEAPEKWKVNTSIPNDASLYFGSPVKLTRVQAPIVKVVTDQGYEVRCTPDHKLATPNGVVEAQRLQVGDELLVTLPSPTGSIIDRKPKVKRDKAAFLMGLIAGDGTYGKIGSSGTTTAFVDLWGEDASRMADLVEEMIGDLYESDYKLGIPQMTPHNAWNTRVMVASARQIVATKTRIRSAWLANYLNKQYSFSASNKHVVPEIVMKNARTDTARFYLAGLFYADGSVQGTVYSGISVRLAQSNREMCRQVQLLLQANGIASQVKKRREAHSKLMPDGRGGHKSYFCKEQHEVIVGRDRLFFAEVIGFAGHPDKTKKAQAMQPNQSTNASWRKNPKVVVVADAGVEDVYCLQQLETRTIIVNGIAATRCGEIWLEEYGCCDLGALVLPRFINNGNFDWDSLDESVRMGIRFLDNVLTINHYPLPEIKDNCEKVRRLGLGVMGLHTMLLDLGMTYDSSEAFLFVDRLFNTIKNTAYDASINLAIEKGPFPAYDPKLLESGFAKTLKRGIRNKIKEHGLRNCALLTIAPTGTTSMVAGVSSGIEPIPAPVYWRTYFKPSDNGHRVRAKELVVEQNLFDRYDSSILQSATDISLRSHFEMQKIVQKHIDNAVSKTINMSEGTDIKDLSEIWLEYLAYCKGTTIYRFGSREFEPIAPVDREDWYEAIATQVHENEGIVDHMTVDEFLGLDCPGGVCDLPNKWEQEMAGSK